MSIDLTLADGLSLRIAPRSENHTPYPTAHIQRGLILLEDQQELCEEAVGFGVPILKFNLRTIFPSQVELSIFPGGPAPSVHATYKLNLEEKIQKTENGLIHSPLVYALKNILAATIRRSALLRGPLTRTSNLLRSWLALETSYHPSAIDTSVSMTYLADQATGKVRVSLVGYDLALKGLTEVIVMNEQGAHHFDRYQDSEGVSLQGEQIGCWDTVLAHQAAFSSSTLGISFSLSQVPGAKLYRGRELVGSRLAWAGFGYSFPPALDHFDYELTIQKSQ